MLPNNGRILIGEEDRDVWSRSTLKKHNGDATEIIQSDRTTWNKRTEQIQVHFKSDRVQRPFFYIFCRNESFSIFIDVNLPKKREVM